MLESLLTKIGTGIAGVLLSIATIISPTPNTGLVVGSQVPVTPAVFETSLASPIGVNDTSMTLAGGTLIDGSTLSGYTCFTLDSGQPNLEYVCGTASGTAVTSMTRGINPLNGTSSVTALKYSHRRGANVKITDYPALSVLGRIANGLDGFYGPVRYDSGVTISQIQGDTRNLASVAYVNQVATSGAPFASDSIAGIAKTSVAPASSTNPIVVGDNDPRMTGKSGSVLSSSNPAIDTLYTATTSSASKVPVASSTGILDVGWIDTGTTANKILKLDSSAKIPAVDGSQITNLPNGLLWATTTNSAFVSSTAENFYASTTVTGGTLGSTGVIRMKAYVTALNVTALNSATFRFYYGSSTALVSKVISTDVTGGAGTNFEGYIEFLVFANGSTSSQEGVSNIAVSRITSLIGNGGTGAIYPTSISTAVGSVSEDSTATKSIRASVQFSNNGASDNITISQVLIEKIR